MKKIVSVGIVCVLVLCAMIVFENFTSADEVGKIQPLQTRLNPIFYKTWGDKNNDSIAKITNDGDYLYLVGYHQIITTKKESRVFLIKMDKYGNEKWNVTLNESGYGCDILVDGMYLYITGYYYNTMGNSDLLLVKYDVNGNLEWKRTWGGNQSDCGLGLTVYNHDIYIAGATDTYGNGDDDALLIKYDENGNHIFNRTWGTKAEDYANDIETDGNYLYLCGYATQDWKNKSQDILFLKYNTAGTLINVTYWGGAKYDHGCECKIVDGFVYICGLTTSYGAGLYDAILLKIDKLGNEVWNVTYGTSDGDDSANDLIWVGGYLYIVGKVKNTTYYENDLFVIKSDTDGAFLWNKTWGGGQDDRGNTLTTDGNFLYIAGYTCSYGAGYKDFLIIKTDFNGDNSTIPEVPYPVVFMGYAVIIIISTRKKMSTIFKPYKRN